MLPDSVMPKTELLTVVGRFLQDENRGISVNLFCELAGISEETLRQVFLRHAYPMSEQVQRRVSKAYKAWMAGEVAIMQARDTSKYVEYRRDPRPRYGRTQRLHVVNGKIQLDIGIRSKHDLYKNRIDDQLKR